ncbi:MAG: thioredoxin [Syntrophomonadaceae bacterium]|nr:thioredoxin [Syntrophomonadaceae bacterium]
MSRRLSFVLILTGLLMFGLGLMRGEALLVMQKAVRICLECIGLG